MGEFKSRGKAPESCLLICTYCSKHRTDKGYWDLIFESYGMVSGTCVSHGICPECLKVRYFDEQSSYCEEGNVVIKDRILPDKKGTHYFFMVNNKGNIHGDNDGEQRL